MNRYLITTADERSWKFDRPILFLGEWCRLYHRKQVWEGMDAVVAEPYGLQIGQKERDLKYVLNLSDQLLKELTDALNAYHNTSHSLRYWNIVLGHWLQRYVAVTFNRYFTLEQALNASKISGTTVFDSIEYSLATTDSLVFIWACNDDVWNHVLYSRILSFLGHAKVEPGSNQLRSITGFFQKGTLKAVQGTSAKRLIRNAARHILSKFSRNHDAFIINSYMPIIEEVKLQLSLGQCPQLWEKPHMKPVPPDPEKRKGFTIDAKPYTGFERLLRLQLSEIIPTCYLEGYDQIIQHIKSSPWPAKPRFIFTSNNFHVDEIFKAWAGAKVEDRITYYTGQHGNNYGTHFFQGNPNWPELSASDKFFTWGWSDGSPNVVPAFNFKISLHNSNCFNPEGGLLLIEVCAPDRITPWDSYFEFGIYQDEQFRFVAALPKAIQQKLTVRLHGGYRNYQWSDEQRWKDSSPYVRIETGAARLQELTAQSRLMVYSYDSTGILETLALNIPTMCFWHGGLDHLISSAKPYYELLRNAGILADTPEQAAELIALHWDNIKEWWESQKVQDARKAFCKQYSRIEKKPVRTMKRLLTMYTN